LVGKAPGRESEEKDNPGHEGHAGHDGHDVAAQRHVDASPRLPSNLEVNVVVDHYFGRFSPIFGETKRFSPIFGGKIGDFRQFSANNFLMFSKINVIINFWRNKF
jgi:hypothetical protein